MFPPILCCSGEISRTRMESIVPSCPASLLCTFCESPLICAAKPTQEWAHDLDLANDCLLGSLARTLHGGQKGVDTFSSLNATLVFTDHLYPDVKQPSLKMKPTQRKEVPRDKERKGFLPPIPSDPAVPNAAIPWIYLLYMPIHDFVYVIVWVWFLKLVIWRMFSNRTLVYLFVPLL